MDISRDKKSRFHQQSRDTLANSLNQSKKKFLNTKKKLLFIVLASFISCSKLGETQTEVNAVQKVLNFYDGQCLKSKGFETKDGVEKNYYELEMSKSDLLNNDSLHLKSQSANIAYLFYHNLENEKSNFNEIRVKINLDNKKSETYNYSDNELIEIEKLMPKADEIAKNILEKNYDKLISRFDKSINIKKENIEQLLTNLENQYGKMRDYQFQGFGFMTTPNYGEVVFIREALVFEKVTANMLLVFSKKNKNLLSVEFP